MMFLDCPAYLDRDGTLRCALPAEVEDRYNTMNLVISSPLASPELSSPALPGATRSQARWFS